MSVLHLWLGLLSSIIIFIVCLTGSIYVFKQQIENFIDRDFAYVKVTQNRPKVNLDGIHTHFKETYGSPTSITVYKALDKSIVVSSFSKNNPGITAYYHPFTGEFIGVQSKSTVSFFAFILDLHRFLLAGDLGKLINGIAVLIFVFMLFSGFIMWLPKKLKQLKQHLTVKLKAKFFRVNYDLHRVVGFYAIPILLVMSITGLYVSFHWVKNAVIIGLGGDSIIISESNIALKTNLSNAFNMVLDDLSEQQNSAQLKEATVQEIVNTATTIYNYDATIILQLPNEDMKQYRFIKMNKTNGLYVPDKIELGLNGHIQKTIPFKDLALNEQFKAIAKPLHTGEIMGFFGIVVYFIFSLIGCMLPITGFIIWIKKAR